MAFSSVNIPPPSLGNEVNSHEIQSEKSLVDEQKKMEEGSTSAPRPTECYEVKSPEIQSEKSFWDIKLKKMEEGSTSSPQRMERYEVKSQEIQPEKSFGEEQKKIEESSTNAPQFTEFTMEMKKRCDEFSQIECFLEDPSQYSIIYRVHEHLRNVNYKAYEPEVIAIGPYHHDKINLKMMEEYKWRYFITIISGLPEKFDPFYSAIKRLEQTARNCYADPISLNEVEFIKMLILDGCFIIELARKFAREKKDSITSVHWMINSLRRDLMLFENQIPFFVLCKLFDLIEETSDQHCHRLIFLLTNFLYKAYFVEEANPYSYTSYFETKVRPNEIKHLLHLMHLKLVSSFEHGLVLVDRNLYQGLIHRGLLGRKFLVQHNFLVDRTSLVVPKFLVDRDRDLVDLVDKRKKMRFIRSATWLAKANVKFKRNETPSSMFEIRFEDGTLVLPSLRIGDAIESFFRNLIAYEQYFKESYNYVTDYVMFLDSLIDSSSDVEILSRFGIINHTFSDDEAAAQAFNKLTIAVVLPGDDEFIYGEIFDKLGEHCSKSRNRWWANLRRNHCNGPWRTISVLAAIVLLLLTFSQTLFSGLSL